MAVSASECLAQRMCRTEMDVAGLRVLLLLLLVEEVSLGLDLLADLPFEGMVVVVMVVVVVGEGRRVDYYAVTLSVALA